LRFACHLPLFTSSHPPLHPLLSLSVFIIAYYNHRTTHDDGDGHDDHDAGAAVAAVYVYGNECSESSSYTDEYDGRTTCTTGMLLLLMETGDDAVDGGEMLPGMHYWYHW